MTDPFRGGGFGSIGMGPFSTGGGGDSRYLIADDGDNVAATRKYSAQVAWANGTITDGAYLGALQQFLGTTEAGSRERIAAQNEYDDAVYTIGRNKLVRNANNATSDDMRVAALRRLIGFDTKKLRSMTKDNEQRRELEDRIAQSENDIRDARYATAVRRYNADRMSTKALLALARQQAAAAANSRFAADWTDRVRQLEDRVDSETLDGLMQDFQMRRIPGSVVIDHLKGRLGRMSESSPDYQATVRQIEDLTKQITETERSDKDAEMASKLRSGDLTDADYIKYLQSRVKDYEKGTPEYRSARDTLLQTRFQLSENSLQRQVSAGTAEPQDLVDFYRGYMASMSPTSSRFLELQARITDLLVSGTGALALFPGGSGGQGGGGVGGYAGAGRWVDLTGAPGGTPVNSRGFASQFDGSSFAGSNCGMASAAMLVWAGTDGRVRVSGGDLRYYSGDRDQSGDERGTTFDDITIGVQALGLGIEQKHGFAFAAFKARLARGEGALISGSYADAPSNLKLSDFTGPHTMYVDRARKINGQWFFWVMDPIGRAGYTGAWWPEAAIKAYGWSNTANRTGVWNGDVAFLGKKGRSSSYFNPDRAAPPVQSFDTDANGRSTVGRGGGKDRAEAGPRRDWSKGRAKEPKPVFTGSNRAPGDVAAGGPGPKPFTADDAAVAEFLAAVGAVERPTMNSDVPGGPLGARAGERGTQAEREAAAKRVLEANGGDARLAAIAWFTGVPKPATDTSTWGGTERFYANAVGTRLGYDPVQRGSVQDIDPARPSAPLGTVFGGARPPQDQTDSDANLPPDAKRIGTMLLERLGVPATPDMVRAVVAWMAAEGNKVQGNNPFVLRTQGVGDIAGQVAKEPQTGLAIFGSLEDGVNAAADELARSFPGLVAAARSGDPERFLVALDRSEWTEGGYRGALVRTYNEVVAGTPGTDGTRGGLIIGGIGGILKGAPDLRGLAAEEPSIAELFDIDPRDPAQMDWLEANVQSIKAAADRGDSTWTFTTPGGQQVPLTLSPSMVGDLTWTKAMYLDWDATRLFNISLADGNAARKKADLAYADHASVVVEMTYTEWDKQMESLEQTRQGALAAGDWATAYNVAGSMYAATMIAFGGDPRAPEQLASDLPGWGSLNETQRNRLDSVMDHLDVRSDQNPDGDALRELKEQGAIHFRADPRTGLAAEITLPPDVAFVARDDAGKLELHTAFKNGSEFALVPAISSGAATAANGAPAGTPLMVPAYQRDRVYVVVDGAGSWQTPTKETLPVYVLDAGGARTAGVAVDITGVGRSVPRGGTRNVRGPGGQMSTPGLLMGGTMQPGPLTTIFEDPLEATSKGGRPGTITNVTREDQQLRNAGVMTVDSIQVHSEGPNGTIKRTVLYRILGSNKWLVAPYDTVASNPPRLVLNSGDGWSMKEGKLLYNQQTPPENAQAKDGVHWYGDRDYERTILEGAAVGAPYSHHKIREGMPVYSGVGVDTGPSSDPVQAFLEGDMPLINLLGGTVRPRFGYRVGPREAAGLGMERTARPGEMPEAGQTEGAKGLGAPADWPARVDWKSFAGPEFGSVPGLEKIAAMNLPMNVGAKGSPSALPKGPGLLASFNTRLSSGVRAAADAAIKVAEAQRTIAAERAATQARLAQQQQAIAAQQAQARMAQQVQETLRPTTPQPTPRPQTQQPTPRPQPTPLPPSMTQTGQNPSPRPTPTPPPTPAASPRRVISPGMEV